MDAPLGSGEGRPGLDVNPERWPDVSRVFAAAVDLDPLQRSGFLDQACAGDPQLRSAVESLLAAHVDAGSFGDTIPLALPSPITRLAPGSQLGPFRVETLLGAGGMGEVYRAYDSKLGRAVALKVLPESFAGNAERRVRFEEEARALAALNHPHIGAIHGLEESGNVAALVLELVEGVTLAERLAEGPMPFDEVTRIARQLADGLEAAHDRGIVHRDFKPANIKITPDATVKILDFGLAKMEGWAPRDGPVGAESPPRSPSRRATTAGAIVGTAAYMSPEQARGQAVDKRADIWAFGCVLFEMCADGPAFGGSTIEEIRRAVIEREPDWQQLRRGTPPVLERILRRCLVKDPKLRLRDIGEVRIALASDGDVSESVSTQQFIAPTLLAIAATLTVAAALWIGWLYGSRQVAPAPRMPVEFPVYPEANGVFRFHLGRTPLALSPDGQRLAYLAASQTDLRNLIWIRERSAFQARALPGTEGAAGFFWSPDGRSLAFLASNKLHRFDFPDGPAVPIADVEDAGFVHGTWGADGVILLGRGTSLTIEAVSATDGAMRVILSADQKNGEARLHWPWFLPDGKRFLFTARLEDGEGELRIGELGGRWRRIMRMTSNAQFVPPDRVVFVREGVLMWQRVDLDAARPLGDPVPIVQPVEYFWTTGRGMFSTSLVGDIAYHQGGELEQLRWTDPTGGDLGTIGSPGNYYEFSGQLSDDDRSLLTARIRPGVGTADIWRRDLARGYDIQLTDGVGSELAPVWAGDGRGIFLSADTGGSVSQLTYRDLVTGQQEQLLPRAGAQQHPKGIFPSDGSLAFVATVAKSGFRMFKMAIHPRGEPVPLLHGQQNTWDLRLSPTGRAVAFVANEPRRKVHVALTDGATPAVLVAEAIAAPPRWSRDGRQIFFVGADDKLMSATVNTLPQLVVDTPRPLFKVKPQTTIVDVAKDGRILLLESLVRAEERPFIVKLNALAPTRQ